MDGLSTRTTDVAIVGGGISGIGAAIRLRERGHDVLVLERAGELGGTWRDNTYPGCACDIPSTLYSYSFAPNPNWSRVFAPQEEIQQYVLQVVDRWQVRECASLDTELLDARWDEGDARWQLDTSTGPVTARHLVLAAGALHEPLIPDLPGLADFEGEIFHSSRWRHDLEWHDRRVAVVGTGASAAQFVPWVQRRARELVVFQRTPAWVLPRPDFRVPAVQRWLQRTVPGFQRLNRFLLLLLFDAFITMARQPWLMRIIAHPLGRLNLRLGIPDRQLREQLRPTFVLGCKRVLVSNTFYPALASDNVRVVPSAVASVGPRSVTDASGTEHPVDTIILATGFHVTDLPIAERVKGIGGTSLAEHWGGQPRAYRGTSIPGFPNAFMLFGPNVGTASAFEMLDAQLGYITDALRQAELSRLRSLDVTPEALAAWNERIEEQLEGTVWTAGGCTSYYLDAAGRASAPWPWTMRRMQRELRHVPLDDFHVEPSLAEARG